MDNCTRKRTKKMFESQLSDFHKQKKNVDTAKRNRDKMVAARSSGMLRQSVDNSAGSPSALSWGWSRSRSRSHSGNRRNQSRGKSGSRRILSQSGGGGGGGSGSESGRIGRI